MFMDASIYIFKQQSHLIKTQLCEVMNPFISIL